MNLEDEVLELVKEKPMLVGDLRYKLQLSSEKTNDVVVFLRNHGLIEEEITEDGMMVVGITKKGLRLLNLPSLPEEESSSNWLELLERHWSDEMDKALDQEADLNLWEKTIDLYPLNQHNETVNRISKMATRFNTTPEDVMCALWAIAKDTVGAKLEQDVKGVKK